MQIDRKYILNFVLFSVGYILLGLLLLFAPEQSKHLISILLGAIAVIGGIARIAWHFAKDDFSRAFHNDIPSGVVLLIAGIYLIARGETVWEWLPVILGFAVVFDSIIKLQHAFDLRRTGFGLWWAVLAAALATAVLGALLIVGVFGSNILLYYFGIVLIVDGVINLGTIALLVVQMKKAHKAGDGSMKDARAARRQAALPADAGEMDGEAENADGADLGQQGDAPNDTDGE